MKRTQNKKPGFSRNIVMYYAAVGIVLIGYLFLSIGGANSFTSLTLGPVILVAGYLVAIPVALLTGIGRIDNRDNDTSS